MRPVLLYDGDCGFCTRSAGWAGRLGLELDIQPLQNGDLPALGVDPARAVEEVPFVQSSGQVVYGHLAIAKALETGNRGLRLVGRFIAAWPVRIVAARVYRLVATHRQSLPGGTAACALPE